MKEKSYPVRILHIVSSMNRQGIENFIMNHYRHIDRNLVQFDFLMEKAQPSDFDDEILALGGKIYRIPMSNPLKYIFKINSFFRTHREYSTCHVHHLPWGAIPMTIGRLYGLKHRISHVHFANDPLSHKRIKNLLSALVRRNSTHYFACSQFAGEKYFGNQITREKNYKVLNNAIDTNKFGFNPESRRNIRNRLDIGEETLVIGQVAGFWPLKNHKFTIDVLHCLKTLVPDFKCLFLGDGPLREEIQEYAKARGVAAECLFLGSVDNPGDYMQAMDLLMFPSFAEGLGMVAIEAQAAGLRCVVSTGVPAECRVSELVEFMPLSAGPEEWARMIARMPKQARRSRVEEIKNAGYDIADTTRNLQNFYLNEL